VEPTGQHRIGGGFAASHVTREQDRDLVKEQEQRLERVDLADAPVRLRVVVRDLVGPFQTVSVISVMRICPQWQLHL
jgi:hypothetical protein